MEGGAHPVMTQVQVQRYGNSIMDTPVLIRTLKLSMVWLCEYLDG